MKRHFDPGIPLFFKLWFGFVACLAISVFIGFGYFIFSVASAGPEGIGKSIGAVVRGFEEARR